MSSLCGRHKRNFSYKKVVRLGVYPLFDFCSCRFCVRACVCARFACILSQNTYVLTLILRTGTKQCFLCITQWTRMYLSSIQQFTRCHTRGQSGDQWRGGHTRPQSGRYFGVCARDLCCRSVSVSRSVIFLRVGVGVAVHACISACVCMPENLPVIISCCILPESSELTQVSLGTGWRVACSTYQAFSQGNLPTFSNADALGCSQKFINARRAFDSRSIALGRTANSLLPSADTFRNALTPLCSMIVKTILPTAEGCGVKIAAWLTQRAYLNVELSRKYLENAWSSVCMTAAGVWERLCVIVATAWGSTRLDEWFSEGAWGRVLRGVSEESETKEKRTLGQRRWSKESTNVFAASKSKQAENKKDVKAGKAIEGKHAHATNSIVAGDASTVHRKWANRVGQTVKATVGTAAVLLFMDWLLFV